MRSVPNLYTHTHNLTACPFSRVEMIFFGNIIKVKKERFKFYLYCNSKIKVKL